MRPVIHKINVINANDSNKIRFKPNSAKQTVANRLIIKLVDTGEIVYDKKQTTLSNYHIIEKGYLSNGNNYIMQLQTFDIDNNPSPLSDGLIFWCYSNPIIKVINIENGKVHNQTYVFDAIYTQNEDEKMESYQYFLYDSNKNLIESFPVVYDDGLNKLQQEITGLKNGKNYFIEVQTMSVNGNIGSSGLIPFLTIYLAPRLNMVLEPKNIPEEGAVLIQANIVQIILEVVDENDNVINPQDVIYVDDDWINMNKHYKLQTKDEFYGAVGGYHMQIWATHLMENYLFFKVYLGNGNYMIGKKRGDIFNVKTYNSNNRCMQSFRSNVVQDWNYDDVVSIDIRLRHGLMDIFVERVM